MTLISTRVTLNMMDGIVSLAVLHLVENFQPYNKHLSLLVRHRGLGTRKVTMDDFMSQLENIWQYQSADGFKELIIENPEWFVEPILHILLGTV